MGIEENKEVVRRIIEEALNENRLEVLPDLISPEYVYRTPLGVEFRGADGFARYCTVWRTAFSDFHIDIIEIIGEGNTVAVRQIFKGTFDGVLENIGRPTGNVLTLPSARFFHLNEEKVIEMIIHMDMNTFFQQAGITPPEIR